MLCSKCGTQNPEESLFCNKCGSALSGAEQTAQYAQAAQNVPPIQSGYNAGQPVYGNQPVQPFQNVPPVPNGYNPGQPVYGQQPQQFQQPYGAPVYTQTAAPKKSYMAIPIVITAVVVLAAFLVVLFLVIIPNARGKNSGGNTTVTNGVSFESRLKHKWLYDDVYGDRQIYDFIANKVTVTDDYDSYEAPFTWSVKTGANGTNVLTITLKPPVNETAVFNASISGDGRSLTLVNVDDLNDVAVFTRYD